ncbi:hypothetical protein TH25_23275 [Thalassospira profundimaris]|uniref:Uncharacterized protein n=1 Tax=Thalassospira profundimaris TaxID=502049 RepID=A0A367WMX6_9PROT|nr:hypothetical protein TH25_23275 [Thalassospira profundimaris]
MPGFIPNPDPLLTLGLVSPFLLFGLAKDKSGTISRKQAATQSGHANTKNHKILIPAPQLVTVSVHSLADTP